ncbi:AzlC family ABC transporter permease [Effusibacillus dendaii]|uniref:Branched-chain amino acid permease n=1 Tax=Effusibacillus dendaii TaxID=2743772 RepID=A0A7I8D6T2_9BACL|nr:AzlC family ABC transporter permease [Effusibacillus dendaii]BCJ85092.1 branched-chain amino acid permease [Effusibacillus dendaii]
MNLQNNRFLQGTAASVPIAIGYLPIAVTFGVLSTQSGISVFQAVLMSLLVYAGASQFMAVSMWLTGAGLFEIVAATFVLNFRQLIMSMTLMNFLRHLPVRQKSPLSLFITDETFAVTSMNLSHNQSLSESPQASYPYLAGLFGTTYASWVIGTLIGAGLANVIPPSVSAGMSIALYAMFIGLLLPAVRESHKVLLLAVVSMLISWLFSFFMDTGWRIVFATLIASFIGVFLPTKR